ncbi:hypothetical protein FKM82_022301 [Ascaphus truei]
MVAADQCTWCREKGSVRTPGFEPEFFPTTSLSRPILRSRVAGPRGSSFPGRTVDPPGVWPDNDRRRSSFFLPRAGSRLTPALDYTASHVPLRSQSYRKPLATPGKQLEPAMVIHPFPVDTCGAHPVRCLCWSP